LTAETEELKSVPTEVSGNFASGFNGVRGWSSYIKETKEQAVLAVM